MKTKFLAFNKNADSLIKDMTQRGKIIAASVALGMSNAAAMPTSPVTNPSSFFTLQVLPTMRNMVSDWNENLVFDARLCLEYIRSFWMIRYVSAHPSVRPVYAIDCSFFETLTGASTYVSPDNWKFLEENKAAILMLSMNVGAEVNVFAKSEDSVTAVAV